MRALIKYPENQNIITNKESGKVHLSIIIGVPFIILIISFASYLIISQPECQSELGKCLAEAQQKREDKIMLCMRSNESRRKQCSRNSNERYFIHEKRCYNHHDICKRNNNVRPKAKS